MKTFIENITEKLSEKKNEISSGRAFMYLVLPYAQREHHYTRGNLTGS